MPGQTSATELQTATRQACEARGDVCDEIALNLTFGCIMEHGGHVAHAATGVL